MLTSFGWVCFGMAVWGLCILMQALQRRFAPELGRFLGTDQNDVDDPGYGRSPLGRQADSKWAAKDAQIAELKQRIEVLEAIVTDRRYQWEQELQRN